MKEYYVVVPKTLDLEKRLKMFPPDFDFNLDFAYCVINDILKYTAYGINYDEHAHIYIEDIYVSRCSVELQSLNRSYRKHMRYLCENLPELGNILWREDYTEGKCYGYKLAPKYKNTEIEAIPIYDGRLIKKMRKNSEKKLPNNLKKTYNFLIDYLDPKKLTIQLKNALKYNQGTYYKEGDYKKYLLNIVKIVKMKNGEHFFSFNPNTDGRVHSSITSFPKKLRKFLRYNNEILGEVDISASVPTLLYYLINSIYYSYNNHIDNIIINKTYYNHYMLVKDSATLDFKEIERFGNLIKKGEFYESFIDDFHDIHILDSSLQKDEYYLTAVKEILNRDFDGDIGDLKAVVKKKTLSMLNAKPSQYLNEQKVFKKQFPTILNFINSLKSKNHKYFSHLMLNFESYFMLNIVARRLNKETKRKIPILTLHDCLITTEKNIKLVHEFMIETLNKELGFKLILKEEVYY